MEKYDSLVQEEAVPDLGIQPATEECLAQDDRDRDIQDKLPAVPAWAIHRTVKDYEKYTQPYWCACFAKICIGPLRIAAILTNLTYLGVFILAYRYSTCSAHVAVYPMWVWLAVPLPMLMRAAAEWLAITVVALHYASCGSFKVLGKIVPFAVWLAFYGSCSQSNFVDGVTDSLFTASMLQLRTCGNNIQHLWEQTWHHSFLGSAGIPPMSLSLITLFFWLASQLQVLVPLLRTMDTSGKFQPEEWIVTLCTGEVSADNVFFALADSNGMATLQVMPLPFAIVKQEGAMLGFGPRLGGDAGAFEDFANGLHFFAPLANQMSERIILSVFLENCVQLNIQGTVYMLQLGVSKLSGIPVPMQARMQLLICIGIGAAMSCLKILDVKDFMVHAKEVRKLRNELGDLNESKVKSISQGGFRTPESVLETQQKYATFKRQICYVLAGCIAMILSLAYLACKLVMAHICRDALWNMTGCVDLRP